LGRLQRGGEIDRRLHRAGSSRIREAFEMECHAVLEIPRRLGEIRQESSGRTPLVGQRQEYEEDDLSVSDALLESFELASLQLELRLLDQTLRLAEALSDHAAHVVELRIRAHGSPPFGAETRQRGERAQHVGKALPPPIARSHGPE